MLKLCGDVRLRIIPLPEFFLKCLAFVDFKLTVISNPNGIPLERTRSRPLEIDSVLVEATAVTRTFELLLSLKPVRRAPKVGTDGLERVNLLHALKLTIHNPDAVLSNELCLDLAGRKTLLTADLEPARGLSQHVGKEEARS